MIDLPDKDRCCHHTGFEKSCRQLVVDGKCQRWRKVWGTPAGEKTPRDIYDCLDDHAHTLRIGAIVAAEYTGKAVDKVHNANQEHRRNVYTAFANFDDRIEPPEPVKLLGSAE